MKLHTIWGYGQLFGYSALDGKNRYNRDFIGTLTARKIEIRFELENWVKVYFPIEGDCQFKAITGDMIEATTKDGAFFLTFLNNDTLVGYSPVKPCIFGEKQLLEKREGDVEFYQGEEDIFAVVSLKNKDGYRFCICHSFDSENGRKGASEGVKADVETLKKARYDYYEKMPECKDERYEQMYYKALSVNKVNVHSPEGKIPCVWTTPDRVPHRHMWLWDSVFHAFSFLTYNKEIAKTSIKAVLSQIHADGFIPHMMNPNDCSSVTQPQVLSWGVWEVYDKTKDKEFLKECAPKLEAYLEWDMKNRDKNNNGLLEWRTNPDEPTNRCDECGQDDTPRFDFDEEMDALDFSTFACMDANYLARIFEALEEKDKAKKWQDISDTLKEKINQMLWCEEDGVYYDRLFDGRFSKVLTPTSFFPLMANIPSKEQAEKMVKVLTDESLLWTKNPLPTVAKNHPTYSTDMWRGGVWLNLNYFIFKGLTQYGYTDIAKELRDRTLAMVEYWYKQTGTIFEFYDPEDRVPPYLCERKGFGENPPDWRKHVHSIVDFNWSSCFTLLFIQNIVY